MFGLLVCCDKLYIVDVDPFLHVVPCYFQLLMLNVFVAAMSWKSACLTRPGKRERCSLKKFATWVMDMGLY